MLGLGTLLITEIGREPHRAGSVTMTAILVVAIAGMAFALVFTFIAPALSAEFAPLSNNFGDSLIFALGVAFTAITLIVDQVMIALLRGRLQLGRNILFAIVKLALLYGIASWMAKDSGMNIYLAWMLGNAISLMVLALYLISQRIRILYPPELGFIRQLGRAALAHHAANLILQAPSLIMPIAVTTVLSASANASFYAAWMVASFVFVLPAHLTTVLQAVGAQSPAVVTTKMRSTMKFSFLTALLVSSGLFAGASIMLSIFGQRYAEQAAWCLRILSLGVFPLIIKYHYVALLRVFSEIQSAIPVLFLGSLLEITLALTGLMLGALTGLSIGWLVAVCVEALFMHFRMQRLIGAQAAAA